MANADQLLPGGDAHSYELGEDVEELAHQGLHTTNPELVPESRRRTHRLLYTSHFLSTWNSRLFEFGVGQRVAVTLSSALLLAMTYFVTLRKSERYSYSLLAILCILAAVEKLSAVINTIAIERDWVVVIAGDNEGHLRQLNSQMRRIDLFCKLAAPLVIALVDAASTSIAIMVAGLLTILSVPVEYFAIARVHRAIPALSEPKPAGTHPIDQATPHRNILRFCKDALGSTALYIHHPVFLPSLALALLYLTVLSFAGQMITYLLSIGVSSGIIALLRGVAAIFEMSATWLGPFLMQRIGTVRAGIWFINWQIFCVAGACLCLWINTSSTVAAAGTVAAVILSRVGLWGFDLCVQIIVQEEVLEQLPRPLLPASIILIRRDRSSLPTAAHSPAKSSHFKTPLSS
ncbi:hypothetical protein LTS16_019962 [Friedmanniomyces endolithicus]|uniref:Solute carrier family 40 member n=1 Tax=Friedmanniomyces endolithicus TaxID=329885 RepID=A0AAN6FB77_9PEZI|nr:hypothetical protein LTS00_016131 [Friedmanniomyces endolithicus]KAK0307708.1 hypothetical protein LTR82_015848 [Friedmanniomyces endolithicus]KAK0926054.1 hypothetical protein LTR57_004303 [Friedmanniomyces endolithicus]KAK1000473.1 hypothetical protein LTR54_008698 [Friedmanniomyces endolithicus]KAK1029146.1 hypothetical protein LTS16_019962 [Friedmanniomyces endolithicus]